MIDATHALLGPHPTGHTGQARPGPKALAYRRPRPQKACLRRQGHPLAGQRADSYFSGNAQLPPVHLVGVSLQLNCQ